MRLRSKLSLSLGIPIALCLGALTLIVVFQTQTRITSLYLQASEQIVTARADEISRWLSGKVEATQRGASEDAITGLDPGTIRTYLQRRKENEDPDVALEFFMDKNGNYYTSENDSGNITDREYYKEIIINKAASYISNAYISLTSGKPVVTIASQSKDRNGALIGLYAADVNIDDLSSIALNVKMGKTGYAVIVDGTVLLIAHPNEAIRMKASFRDPSKLGYKGLEPGIEKVLKKQAGTQAYTDDKDIAKYFIFAPITGTPGWAFGVIIPAKEISAIATGLGILLASISLAVLVFLIILVIVIINALTRPICTAGDAIKEIAIGDADLTKSIDLERNDEVGDLVKNFNLFVEKLRGIVGSIKHSQEELGTIGLDLASSSQESASATAQILANISGVRNQTVHQNTCVDDASSAVEEVAKNIESLDRLVETQSSGLTEASASIEQMVGNIASVTASIEKMAAHFETLISSSGTGKTKQQAVDEKVKEIASQSELLMEANNVIAKIASMTNLLAMNAAIEAAHAGDAGKGFSVVADEIRHLAETSAEQSHNIGAELKKIGSTIQEVVIASASSGDAFGSVAEGIDATADLVREISRAMIEQKEGSRQILEALRDMNGVTSEVQAGASEMNTGNTQVLTAMRRLTEVSQTISGSMDEMGAGAEEINKAAQAVSELANRTRDNIHDLESVIGRFKI